MDRERGTVEDWVRLLHGDAVDSAASRQSRYHAITPPPRPSRWRHALRSAWCAMRRHPQSVDLRAWNLWQCPCGHVESIHDDEDGMHTVPQLP